MYSVSPIWTEAYVEMEKIIALDQPQYAPIVGLPVKFQDGIVGICVRFRFTDDERKAIAEGHDLIVTELTGGELFTPLNMGLCKPDTNPFE